MDEAIGTLALGAPVLPSTGPVPAVADERRGQASADRRRVSSRAAAAEVLFRTRQHWQLANGRIVPRGDWLRCPVCHASQPVIRYWMYHVRPGQPTVPYRCDVGLKCSECAAGWWHGVAIGAYWWARRPRPVGLRRVLSMGSAFEPKVWASDRGVRSRG